MDDKTYERAQSVLRGFHRTITFVENTSLRLVRFLDDVSENFEDEIERARERYVDARNECMENHPAGKGRTESGGTEELTREDKIKHIQDWLSYKGTKWHLSPEEVTDNTINWAYQWTKMHPQ